MKIGIIGMSRSGKTTIFNALTELEAETGTFSNKIKPNLGTVTVEDSRITKLSDLYVPKKTIYAQIEFMDFSGMSNDENTDSFPPQVLSLIKTTDALVWVIRNFEDEYRGKIDILNEIDSIKTEIIMSDLLMAENRKTNIENSLKRGAAKNIKEMEDELKVLKKVVIKLNNEEFLKDLELNESEKKSIKGFQFLSMKEFMIVLNSDEDKFGMNKELIENISKEYEVIEFAGKFESELSQLDEEEVQMFMEDIGIKESAKSRLTNFAYKLLGYISFFTVGKDEVRAWTISKGADAVEAAGTIHSDLAKGFIRAECFNYSDLIEFGSEKEIKSHGKFRLEGKTYIVNDGDILNIRFNV